VLKVENIKEKRKIISFRRVTNFKSC